MQRVSGIFLAVFLLFAGGAAAAEISGISPDGILTLADGEKVRLGGIVLSDEGIQLLPVLLSGREVSLDRLRRDEGAEGPDEVLIFVETSQIDFPFLDGKESNRRMAVNEWLIQKGAARVRTDIDFHGKDKFLSLEYEARQRGEGIWSYDVNDP